MIKTFIKLALVVFVANASWQIGSAYVAHYKFTDSVQQTTLFRGRRTDDMLRVRLFELASTYDIPVTEASLTLRSEDYHTIVEGEYTRQIELLPGFKYPWPFRVHVDTLSGIL